MQLQCSAHSRQAEEKLPASKVCSRPLLGWLGGEDCRLLEGSGSACMLRPCSQQCSSMHVLIGTALSLHMEVKHAQQCQPEAVLTKSGPDRPLCTRATGQCLHGLRTRTLEIWKKSFLKLPGTRSFD